jgi:internalin A
MDEAREPATPRRRNGCFLAITGLAGIVILLIVFAPTFYRWKQEATLRARMSRVKEDNTIRIAGLEPDLVEYLLRDAECAKRVREVWISNASDERFRSLKQLPHLNIIRLDYLGRVDAFLEYIQGMASLEELHFHRASVSKEGVRWLASFPNLKRLSIDSGTDLAFLDALKGRASIEFLGLYGYTTTADRLAVLKTLPNLRELTLELELENGAPLDLRGLPKLEKLDIMGPVATDAALTGLEEMKNLTELALCGHQITDAGLKHLRGLRALKKVELSFTQVSDQGVKDLQQALPNCKITY